MQVFTEISAGIFEDLFPEVLVERLSGSLRPVIEELMIESNAGSPLPEDVCISISLLEEDGIRDLNRSFLGEDSPTDVLSFPLHAGSGAFVIPADVPLLLLGDIVICPSMVRINAVASYHSFERELSLVIIHGLLHLFGMDHDTEDNKEAMWRSQERYWDTIEQALSPPGSRGAGNS
ncbi:MAG: rRNA maturation RNase YbeY [Thermovirga sp.]